MPSSRAVRPSDEFLRPYRIGAVALLVLGVLCLLVELQSSSLILWTGERVQGTNDGGIVYYTVAGDERTLTGPGAAPPTPVPVTVYADPDDSSHDLLAGPAKWFDAAFVTGPFVVAAGLLGVGLVRRRRWRARRVRAQDGSGAVGFRQA